MRPDANGGGRLISSTGPDFHNAPGTVMGSSGELAGEDPSVKILVWIASASFITWQKFPS